MYLTSLGILAAVLTSISFVPQVYKVYKTNNTDGISFWMFLLFSLGVLLWLVYGLLKIDTAIIVANMVTLSLCLYILYKKITHLLYKK